MTEPIKIDIWSDVACPWCYIGKRKLENGIEAYSSEGDALPVEIEYHSYELSPETPVDFEGDEYDFLAAKGYPREQLEGMLTRVTSIASDVGLDYDYDHLKHTNTVKAHQLIHYAKAHGRQLDMKERLLKAYFVDGRHVGHVSDLGDLAAEIGLDRDDVIRSLEADEYLDDVRTDQAEAQRLGIQGVPFFVLDGKYGVSGAQDAAVFADVLRQVQASRVEVGS